MAQIVTDASKHVGETFELIGTTPMKTTIGIRKGSIEDKQGGCAGKRKARKRMHLLFLVWTDDPLADELQSCGGGAVKQRRRRQANDRTGRTVIIYHWEHDKRSPCGYSKK